MSDAESLWTRLQVSEVGLSIEIYQLWPLESIIEADRGNIYQTIADTGGLVFLRYGNAETVEAFLPKFSDFVTTTSTFNDEIQTYCGRSARRVTFLSTRQRLGVYRDDPDAGFTHEVSPEVRTIITVIGFQSRDIPVLVGYRLPEESLPTYRTIVERILNSVSVT